MTRLRTLWIVVAFVLCLPLPVRAQQFPSGTILSNPCLAQKHTPYTATWAAATTGTQLVAQASGQTIYVCSITFGSNAVQVLSLAYSATAGCTSSLTTGPTYYLLVGSNGAFGGLPFLTVPSGDCLGFIATAVNGSTPAGSVSIEYVQQAP